MSKNAPLSGLRILVVEDVFLVACDLADQLTAAGCEVVGPVPSVEQAFQRMDGLVLDGALLDVNLRGERSFPIAEHFATEGIPFIFLTGYDSVTVFPERFRESPRLLKPVDAGVLTEAVANFRRT